MKSLTKSVYTILISLSISTISPAQVIFEDDFSSGNLNNWTILSGSWDVINGEMCAIADGSTITANTGTLTSYIFETEARFEAGLAWGIDFRYIDPYNRVRLDFAPGAPNQLNVNIYENGVFVAQPYAGSCSQYGYYTQHYCKFVVEGSYFEVYFGNDPDNLDLLCTYTYPAFDSGTIRYEAWGYPPNVMSCFDNVLITGEDEWTLIYEEDFSSDPGWMTNNSSHFYWNPSEENYYAYIETNLQEYGVIQVQELDGSFKVEFDAKLTQNDWSTGLNFGVYDDEIAFHPEPTPPIDTLSTLNLEFTNPDAGRGFSLWSYTPPLVCNYIVDYCGFSLGSWYHVVIEYDAETSTASYEVTQNGTPISSNSLSITGSYLGLEYLGISRRWFTYVGGLATTAYVDNVELWALGQPPPPPPPPALFDDFEDGNADGWEVVEGNWGINSPGAAGSDYCYGTSSLIAAAYPEEFTASFFELEVDFWINCENTGNFDVEFNYQCANNYYMLDLADPDSDDPNARIYRYINGVQTIIAEIPNIIQEPDWHHLRLIRNSDCDIVVFLDNDPTPFIIVNDGELTCDSEVRFRFYAGGDIDNVVLITIPLPSPVTITLTPYNPPIIIPPGGDAFAFNVVLANNGNEPTTFDVWLNIEVPGGYQFTILEPVYNLTLEAGSSIERDRTVFVPGNAPAGEYICIGMIGTYPWNVVDSDAFPFIKEGADGIWMGSEGWICTGELFPGEDITAGEALPAKFALHGAYPNPFNAVTNLTFDLPEAGKVSLVVYDVMGREVARLIDGWTPAGVYQMIFDASGLSSGIYFARLVAGDFHQTRKLLLLK